MWSTVVVLKFPYKISREDFLLPLVLEKMVGFPYLLWNHKTSQKRHWKLIRETHFMSFTEFLLGIHGADVKNIHLDKAKAINVISLWVHFSSVSSV